MVIQVSVNYSNIADQLSDHLAEITDSITVFTQWLDLYDRPSMQVLVPQAKGIQVAGLIQYQCLRRAQDCSTQDSKLGPAHPGRGSN
ncbi:hypothetical protein BDV19DRAFT_373772 [Aspergillus venezuelensis]